MNTGQGRARSVHHTSARQPLTATVEPMTRWAGFDPAKLREARQSQHLTQDQVAERLGVTRHRMSEWENGQRIPQPASLRALADALRVPPHELSTVTDLNSATLKDLRYFAGLDVAEVAGRAEISTVLLLKLEAGQRTPKPELAEALARLYRVTTDELLAAHAHGGSGPE